MILGRATWIADRPPIRAYVFARGILEFEDEPSRALSHLIGVIDRHRNTVYFEQSQYVIAGVWAEPAPEYEAKARQVAHKDFTNTLLQLMGKEPLFKDVTRTWCDPVVVCMSYWPQKTGEHVSKERFKKYEYDDEHRRENPGLRDGLPPEFLEVLDLEEAHRKKMPNLETFLRNPPKLDDASLCVDKIYEMPPA